MVQKRGRGARGGQKKVWFGRREVWVGRREVWYGTGEEVWEQRSGGMKAEGMGVARRGPMKPTNSTDMDAAMNGLVPV